MCPPPSRADVRGPQTTARPQSDLAIGDLSPMNRSSVANRGNLDLIEGQYHRWREDPGLRR